MKNDKSKIQASLQEERKAVSAYTGRAARAKSPAVKKTIEHIRGEEKHHIRLLEGVEMKSKAASKSKIPASVAHRAKAEGESMAKEMRETKMNKKKK